MEDHNYTQVKFSVYRNINYHYLRYRFFNRLDKGLNFIIIASGSTALTQTTNNFQKLISIIVATLGIIQLVYDPRGSSIRHDNLSKSYHKLLNDMLDIKTNDEEGIKKAKQEIVRISSEEPPPLKVLDLIAHNRSCDTLGYSKDKKLKIPLIYRMLSNFISFENFKLLNEKIDEKI